MRLGKDAYMMMMALAASQRATCPRRQVGAVICDNDHNILSTGYNGVPTGFKHCTDVPCPGANQKSGSGLDACRAIHAEANAILHCSNLSRAGYIYCTDSPCIHCLKLLLGTPIHTIIYLREYPHTEAAQEWLKGGRHIAAFQDISQLTAASHVYAELEVELSYIVTQLKQSEDNILRLRDEGSGIDDDGSRLPEEEC